MRGSGRAVSTAVDVALFLLLVSAAVGLLTYGIDDADSEPAEAERIAETLAATTTTVEYSLEPVERHDDTGTFDDADFDNESYERTGHGPVAGLLAEAAVTNGRIDGERITYAGEDFETAVERNALGALEGEGDIHVHAAWRPYEDASIDGEASTGRTPPPDADVTSATMTVSSGHPPVDGGAVAEGYEDGDFADAACPIADAIVEGYLPTEQSQLALEGQGTERDLVVSRYKRLADVLEVDLDAETGDLSRSNANASAANDRLAAQLAPIVTEDLEAAFGPEVDRIETEYPADQRDAVIGETIADGVSTGEATITVRTW